MNAKRVNMLEENIMDMNKKFIKLGRKNLTIGEAFIAYRAFDELVEHWDMNIVRKYRLVNLTPVPEILCRCGCNNILPYDYYINDDRYLVICGKCRGCGGYTEYICTTERYPVQFKEPPVTNGLLFQQSPPDRKNDNYYL